MVSEAALFSFRCSACGKCCNSPPRMSLPEIFRFQRIFVGCLAVYRFTGAPTADTIALRDRLMFRVPHATGRVTHVGLLVQGYDYEGVSCPALRDDGRCALHEDGKPSMCEAVPLDPLVADGSQPPTLAQRRLDAAYFAADCIVAGTAPDFPVLTDGAGIIDAAFAASLNRHRASLAEDKRQWGNGVFRILAPALFPDSASLQRIPENGFMSLPLVPALAIIAGASDRCRARCVEFIDAQSARVEAIIRSAVTRGRVADRPMTRRLRGWSASYRDLRAALVAPAASAREDRDMERWLGVGALDT
ncbi:MAG TPA: hypothetical protein VMB71_08080 [Acetobacteraceae bacterium]|nr:hypothetical protein [Acetobacteraceae bacterium]